MKKKVAEYFLNGREIRMPSWKSGSTIRIKNINIEFKNEHRGTKYVENNWCWNDDYREKAPEVKPLWEGTSKVWVLEFEISLNDGDGDNYEILTMGTHMLNKKPSKDQANAILEELHPDILLDKYHVNFWIEEREVIEV